MNVVSLAKTETTSLRARRAARVSVKVRRQQQHQAWTASGLGLVVVVLLVLSLDHQMTGIQLVTHSPTWEAWAMAIGIDLGFVGLEFSQLTITHEYLRRRVNRYSKPAIIGTLIGSALFNALAFSTDAGSIYMQVAGVAIGLAIPALIFALTKVAATTWLDLHSKK